MESCCSGVYAIINLMNNKVYVGSACDLKRREADHVRRLRGGYHDNLYLQNSWNKYGESNFTFGLLEECELFELIPREQYWIDEFESYLFKNGYNRSPTAGSPLGVKHSDETKAKMSERMLGKPMPDWVKEKIRAALKGKTKSEDHRSNLWNNRRGWKHSEESKMKIARSLRKAAERGERSGPPEGWKHSEESRKKMSKAHKGVRKSAEHRAKIAAALKGKSKSAQHIANITKSKRRAV